MRRFASLLRWFVRQLRRSSTLLLAGLGLAMITVFVPS
jgi:hypothetical protein